MRERHTQGYALALLGGALTWNPGCPLQPALLPEAAGSEEGGVNQACYPWVNQVGIAGKGHQHLSHFRRLAKGRERERLVVDLPLPLTPLLAAFPKHLVGAH